MSYSNYSWDQYFLDLFDRCLDKYRAGNTDFESYYSDADLQFLSSIGYRKREFFDFIEDYGDDGEPGPGAALLIAAARRDYFLYRMDGKPGETEITPDQLPGKQEELGGFVWLPRILAKARGKLRGELHPDIMYSCGGDRNFLRTHDISGADFLRTVWSVEGKDDPDREMVEFVKSVSKA